MIPLPYSFPLVQNAMKKPVDLLFLVWEAGSTSKHLSAHSYRCFAVLHTALFAWNLGQQPAVIHSPSDFHSAIASGSGWRKWKAFLYF